MGEIGERIVSIRCKAHGLPTNFRSLLVLPPGGVQHGQIDVRASFPGVALNLLLKRLGRFIEFPGNNGIEVGGDRQLLAFTSMFPHPELFGEILAGPPNFVETGVVAAHCAVAHGEIRIKLDGTLVVRQGGGGSFLSVSLHALAICLQRFERRRGDLFERCIILLHRSQRFAWFAAQLGRRPAQHIQHLFLGHRSHLLLCQRAKTIQLTAVTWRI